MPKTKSPTLTTEEKAQMRKEAKALEHEAIEFAAQLIDNWQSFAKKRLDQIREMELSYNNNVRPNLKGRSNFPFPTMPKYVDELKGRLDDFPGYKVSPGGQNAKSIVANKIRAAFDQLKKPTKGDWARNDRMGRTFSIFAGFNVMDFFTEVDARKGFLGRARPIDHNDLVADPLGGSDLETHRGVGEFPILRTESDMMDMVEAGVYRKEKVQKLLAQTDRGTIDKYKKALTGRYARYKALGIDLEAMKASGENIFALAQMQFTFKGKRYMATFDYQTRIAVRFEPLEDIFTAGRGCYSLVAYQTHEDPNSLLCKAPVDDIYAVAESIRLKINQMHDASTKALWGQTVYDPEFFPDPSQLEWRRPDQLIVGRTPSGKQLSQGIHKIQTTFDMSGNLAFVKYLDQFLASVVGINPNEVSDQTKKVGVLFGQLGKTAARLGPQNKSYAEMWHRGLLRIVWGMVDNMDEAMMVRLIGTKGVEWEELTKKEIGDAEDYDIIVDDSAIEAEMNEAIATRKQKAIEAIKSDPDLKKEVSARWIIEEILKGARYDEEEVRRAMDTKSYGSEDQISRADLAIEQILKGKMPKLYQGAEIPFMQYIFDYGMRLFEEDELTAKERVAILHYGQEHKEIVVRNMTAKAMEIQAANGTPPDQMPDPAANPRGGAGQGGPVGVPTPAPTPVPAMPTNTLPNLPAPAARALPAPH